VILLKFVYCLGELARGHDQLQVLDGATGFDRKPFAVVTAAGAAGIAATIAPVIIERQVS
jgi:hypothetical protein